MRIIFNYPGRITKYFFETIFYLLNPDADVILYCNKKSMI